MTMSFCLILLFLMALCVLNITEIKINVNTYYCELHKCFTSNKLRTYDYYI